MPNWVMGKRKADTLARRVRLPGGSVRRTVMRQLTVAACAVASLCLAVSPVAAPVYSAFYVFGDSLSDVGNVYAASGGAEPASPYYAGEFSNGPIWAQVSRTA